MRDSSSLVLALLGVKAARFSNPYMAGIVKFESLGGHAGYDGTGKPLALIEQY